MKKLQLFTVAFIAAVNGLVAQSNTIGSGISMQFDGNSNNYYDCGDYFNSLNFPVTFEAWVYQTAYSTYSPIFATDSYTSGNYYGMYIRFDITGKLIFEIGDGVGAGPGNRRGKITSSTAPLNKWTHVAVVATSATDIKFYFNGVLQPAVNTDGTATITAMVHNSNHINLGRYATVHASNAFTGLIDEVRLWSVARTETDLRDKMCEKLTGTETGLIGWWKADESYTSPSVNDNSATGANGLLFGTLTKVTSGAPIGNLSMFNYSTDYTGVTLSLNSPGGDKFKVNKIANTPKGVHIYRVNTAPYFNTGLGAYTGYYFGVFTADGAVAATYTLNYTYSFSNGVVNAGNELGSSLFKRLDNSVTTWSLQSATLNTTSDLLTKKLLNTRNEYIFNIDTVNQPKLAFTESQLSLSALTVGPVPSGSTITISGIDPAFPVNIFDMEGRVIATIATTDVSGVIEFDVSDMALGVYFVAQASAHDQQITKFVVR